MRRIQYISVVLLLLISGFAACSEVAAQNAPVSAIGMVTTYGNTATVPVTATGFTNIGSFNLQVAYDAAIASPSSVTAGPLLGGNFTVNLANPGIILLSWYTFSGLTLAGNPLFSTSPLIKLLPAPPR